MITVNWTAFKAIITGGSLLYKYYSAGGIYYLTARDGSVYYVCQIAQSGTPSDEQVDFETNYMAGASKDISSIVNVTSQPPFGAKTIVVNGVTKKLYARFTGNQYSVTTGSNVLSYVATYPWSKIIGIEVVNCEALDTADLKVFDTATGTYSGVPNALLNQFSYSLNLSKDFYQRMAQFDADLFVGMIIQVTYVSSSNKTVGINLLMNEVK